MKPSGMKIFVVLIALIAGLGALFAAYLAFSQNTDLRSRAAEKKCFPRPECLDETDPTKRCDQLIIPNVCPQ